MENFCTAKPYSESAEKAMGYMLLSPGKRIRAAMVRWVCRMLSRLIDAMGDRRGGGRDGVHIRSSMTICRDG